MPPDHDVSFSLQLERAQSSTNVLSLAGNALILPVRAQSSLTIFLQRAQSSCIMCIDAHHVRTHTDDK